MITFSAIQLVEMMCEEEKHEILELIGIEECIFHLGVDDFIEEIGVDQMIDHHGLEHILEDQDPEEVIVIGLDLYKIRNADVHKVLDFIDKIRKGLR